MCGAFGGISQECGQWKLNQKGFTWELGVTKFQIMVPFYVSSRRYGFLWNHPGTGGSLGVGVGSWKPSRVKRYNRCSMQEALAHQCTMKLLAVMQDAIVAIVADPIIVFSARSNHTSKFNVICDIWKI